MEKVAPALVLHDDHGKPYTVRYDAVNAMLLNEFLKEHRKVEAEAATVNSLKKALAQQDAKVSQQEEQIKALTSGLQKVNNKLEMTRPTARVVKND